MRSLGRGGNLVCWSDGNDRKFAHSAGKDDAAVEMFDILAPMLMVAGAITVVALVYLLFATLKDRSARKREEELENGYRSGNLR